ncbi:glutathione S-transferase family protein [Paucibacter sp. AS339]|uniref:glutathione S-transferase n=1 Tax=Paucibacter hankyongi TaxID=3133434 RepID=UPI0030B420ED
MPQLKLTYFDTHGGRGEPARLAMRIGNIPFEDHRFKFPDFAEVRKSTPFGQVPTLHVDGQQITQSDAITRYVGKLAGLYPTDAYQALLCDEVLDAMEELNVKLGQTFGLPAEALKVAREALVQGPLTLYLGWLQTQLRARGGQYFADQRLTIADLKVFVLLRWLNSGRLDHVPTDLVARVAPDLLAHLERVAATPAILQYYASVQA